jgi:hypothetical protein
MTATKITITKGSTTLNSISNPAKNILAASQNANNINRNPTMQLNFLFANIFNFSFQGSLNALEIALAATVIIRSTRPVIFRRTKKAEKLTSGFLLL